MNLAALGGLNQLIAFANPILSAIPQIGVARSHPDPERLKETLQDLVEAFEAGAGKAGVSDATDLLRTVNELRPYLAIVDVRMPPTFTDEGIRAAALLRSQNPESPVLVLSHYVEERYAADLIASDTRGFGYLLKDRVADVPSFLDAVAVVGGGGTALDPEVVSQILVRSRQRSSLDGLTARELEGLQLMAEGRANSAIASALHVSVGSAEKHIASIFAKLGPDA